VSPHGGPSPQGPCVSSPKLIVIYFPNFFFSLRAVLREFFFLPLLVFCTRRLVSGICGFSRHTPPFRAEGFVFPPPQILQFVFLGNHLLTGILITRIVFSFSPAGLFLLPFGVVRPEIQFLGELYSPSITPMLSPFPQNILVLLYWAVSKRLLPLQNGWRPPQKGNNWHHPSQTR